MRLSEAEHPVKVCEPSDLDAAKPKDQFSREEAAHYITRNYFTITPRTLANMASNNNAGNGPPYTRIGWRSGLIYLRSDLDLWAKNRFVRVNADTRRFTQRTG